MGALPLTQPTLAVYCRSIWWLPEGTTCTRFRNDQQCPTAVPCHCWTPE